MSLLFPINFLCTAKYIESFLINDNHKNNLVVFFLGKNCWLPEFWQHLLWNLQNLRNCWAQCEIYGTECHYWFLLIFCVQYNILNFSYQWQTQEQPSYIFLDKNCWLPEFWQHLLWTLRIWGNSWTYWFLRCTGIKIVI